MADNNEAESKKIAKLSFNVDTSNLESINKTLKEIAEESKGLTDKISKNLQGGIDSKIINSEKIKKQLSGVEKITEGSAKKLVAQVISEETKLANNRKKNADNQVALEKQVTTKLYEHEEKINDKIKLLNAKKNAQIEVDNNKAANKQIANNNRVLKSTETMYDKIIGYAKTYLIYQGFNELKRGIQETIDEMVDVQYQMVQIDRVLNDNSLNIDDYRDKLMQLAYDYGNSFSNVSDITLRLAQAGFDADESLALTEKTLLALNTAELNATQATSDMVAVMAQWGLMTGDAKKEAKDYGDIIDKINKVADNFPTTSEDILNALKKTSSAFNIAGASIDETIATIVAAEKASQRGGKVIGTALSNIVQQLRAEGKLDLAEQLGLDFFEDDAKTKFKPLMEIFGEMSNMMQKLKDEGKGSSIEMQHLLEMFTVFRRNIGASLLGEMAGEDSTYQKVLKTSIESVGYSLAENEKHMKTAKAAQEQFNAELLKLKTTIWDNGLEDVFRSMLLLGKDVSNVIKGLIDTFGTVPTAMGVATLAFTTFNKNMKNFTFNVKDNKIELSGLIKKIVDTTNKIREINKQFNVMKDGQIGLTEVIGDRGKVLKVGNSLAKQHIASLVTETAKTIGLEAATIALNAAISLGLSVGISALLKLFDNLIHRQDKYIEKIDEEISKTREKLAEIESEKEALDSLTKEYDKLAKKENKTPEEKSKIYEIQLKINQLIGDQGKTIDLVNGKYEEELKTLREITLEKQKQIVQEKAKIREEKYSKRIGISTGIKTDTFMKKENQMRKSGINFDELYKEKSPTGVGWASSFNELDWERQLSYLTEWQKKLQEAENTGKDVSEALDWVNESLETLNGQEKEAKDATEDYYNELAKLKIDEYFPEDKIKNVEDYKKAIDAINSVDFSNMEGFKEKLLDIIQNKYPEFVSMQQEVVSGIDLFKTKISSTTEELAKIETSLGTLNAAQKEYNETGHLTTDTLMSIINSGYWQYIDIVNGKMDISRATALLNADAIKENAIASMQAQAAERIQAIVMSDVTNKMKEQKTAANNVVEGQQTAAQAVLNATEAYIAGKVSLQEYNKVLKDNNYIGKDIAGLTQGQLNQIQGVLGQLKTATNVINSIRINPARVSGGGSRGSSGRYTAADRAKRDAEREKRERERAAEEARRAEEKAYKERLKKFEDYLKEKERLEKRWVKKQEDLGLLTNTDYLYITEQRIKRHKKYLDEIKKATWMNAEDRLELEKEYSEKIEDLQLDYMDYLKKQLEDNIDALEKSNDKQMDLINKEADKKIQALRKVEKETDRIREKEEYERRRKAHLDDISYWEQRTGREAQENLLEAKKRLKELDREWKETQENWNTEDQIKQIESARDAEIKAIEDQQKAQIEAWQKAYDEKVKMFAETGKIIYDGTVMQSEALYNAYKQKFIDPIKEELANLNKSNVVAPTKPTEEKPKPKSEAYIIQWGDTLSSIARKFGTTIDKIMQANPNIKNKNRIYAGSTLQIPKFHNGGEVGGTKEGYALLKPHEMILKPKWAAGVEKLANMAMKSENNAIGQTTNIEVKGDLVKMNADIKNKGDVDYMVRKVEKMLKDKFNIKK